MQGAAVAVGRKATLVVVPSAAKKSHTFAARPAVEFLTASPLQTPLVRLPKALPLAVVVILADRPNTSAAKDTVPSPASRPAPASLHIVAPRPV